MSRSISSKDFKYGISKTSILVHGLTNNRKPDDRTAVVGTIVKIEGTLDNGNIVIRFLDARLHQFEDSKYYGKQLDFIPVAEKLWPLLLAMPSPLERVSVAAYPELCDKLINLTINSKTEVLYNKIYFSAVVRYIGPVDTMGPGYYLGLELVNRTQITKCDGSYADKHYFSALPGTALFVSIEKIRPVPHYLATNPKRYTNFSPYDSYSQPDSGEMRNPTLLSGGSKDGIIKTAEISQIEKPARSSTGQKVTFAAKLDNEMDLIELIGGSWPGVTDSANYKTPSTNIEIPSTSSIQQQQNPMGTNTLGSAVKLTRNKSLNPVSHLMNQKKVMRSSQPRNELINLSLSPSALNTSSLDDDVSAEDRITSTSTTTYDTPNDSATNLSVGTLVEVVTDISDPLYGVIRWVGNNGLAGVELEEDHEHLPLVLTDGTHNGNRYFSCANGRALFVPMKQCQKDSRFDDVVAQKDVDDMNSSKMFGQVDSPIVPGSVAPLSMPTEEDVLAVCGKYRGIQGHHNSCYLDATLFAMFTYTGVFDSLLFRPRASNDISHYEEVQKVLREEIVNPLRQNLYVRADRVMKLRTLLEELSSVSGLTSEEKDPEEFLNSLLAQILKAEPFLKLSSGQEAFHYQLFVEKDEGLALPSVQQLFEQSFLSSDIKLKEVPSCLIIQMPRFGKSFKMYPRILPSQLLDVTDIIENSPRQCTVCGKLAQYECRDCFGQCSMGLESTAFCGYCLETAHTHVKRSSHSPRPLTVPHDFAIIAEHCRPPPRLYMELFAVVCIETSHYVAFVKCGSGHEAPWCFFDSMADRKGEQNGYNIPEMVACPDVSTWLSDDGAESRRLHETHPHDKQLPEHARRLLCDAYICMYQSPDVMMYR